MEVDFASKKILILYCGGGDFNRNLEEFELEKWLDDFLELQILAQIKGEFIYSGPGSQVGPKQWLKIAETVKDKYQDYDGFVVTHGVDNVLYTANMVNCLLGGLGKPVVFTGSALAVYLKGLGAKELENIFEKYSPSELTNNLLNAVQAATMPVAGVSILYDGHLIQADRAKLDLASDHIFKGQALANINFGMSLTGAVKPVNTKFNPVISLEPKVKILSFNPLGNKDFDFDGYKGVVVRGYLEDRDFRIDTNLPILAVGWGNYKEHDNLIVVKELTEEAAICRFMWALSQTSDLETLKQLMHQGL